MDLRKCRTCFTDLEANDFFMKLNVKHKNSPLTFAEKLKVCMPDMDIKAPDQLYICMQCTMNLETAFSFHMTCLQAEEQIRKYTAELLTAGKLKTSHLDEEKSEKKDVPMYCSVCNISFSSKNIFDLHMKVLHAKDALKNENVDVKDDKKKKLGKPEVKNNNPLVQMVFLQTTIGNSQKRRISTHESDKDEKNVNKDAKRKYERNAASYIRDRRSDGKFKKFQKVNRKSPINIKNKNEKSNEIKTEQEKHSNEIKMEKEKKFNENKHESDKIGVDMVIKTDTKSVIKRNTSNSTKNSVVQHSQVKDKIKCKFCSKLFSDFPSLTRHLMQLHKDKCTECGICGRYYTNTKEHKKRYGCHLENLSSTMSSNKSKNIIYRLSRDKKLSYIVDGSHKPMCIVCRKKCSTIKELRSHIRDQHKTSYTCKKCKRHFGAFMYCLHVSTCQNEESTNDTSKKTTSPTTSTPKTTPSEWSFFNYTSDGDCICPICNKIFPTPVSLRGHMSAHYQDDLRCKLCKEKFKQIKLYCQHILKGCDLIEKKKTEFIQVDSHMNKSSTVIATVSDPLAERAEYTDSLTSEDPTETVNTERSAVELNTTEEFENGVNIPDFTGFANSPRDISDIIAEKMSRNVKIEPTQLLDQSSYFTSDDAIASADNLLSGLEQFDNLNSDIIDQPDLVYFHGIKK